MPRTLQEAIKWLKQYRAKCRPADLLEGMCEQGCKYKNTGDGWLIWHEEVVDRMENVAKPHGRASGNVVRPHYVRRCQRLLEALEDLRNEGSSR